MNERKKVFFFVPSTIGGAERVTITIAKLLPTRNYDVHIIYVDENKGDLGKFVPDRLKTHTLGIRRVRDFASLRILFFLLKEKPYAVFSSLQYLNVRLPLIAKLAGIKKIVIRNDIGWNSWIPLYKKIARLSFPCATSIICQTEEMRDEFCTAFPTLKEKIITIPNPLDIDTITKRLNLAVNPYSHQGTKFVYAGRISYDKGLDVLIDAFAIVKKQDLNATLSIVGEYNHIPEYYKSLLAQVNRLGLNESVVFTGFQDNPYKYIKYADCLVLPSRREGNPNIVHEAMWIGVPVVATRSVPIVDRIVSPQRGFVVDVDDVEALAEAMLKGCEMQINSKYDYSGGKTEFVDLF